MIAFNLIPAELEEDLPDVQKSTRIRKDAKDCGPMPTGSSLATCRARHKDKSLGGKSFRKRDRGAHRRRLNVMN